MQAMNWTKEEMEMISFLRTRGWVCDSMGCQDPLTPSEGALHPRAAYGREVARQPRGA